MRLILGVLLFGALTSRKPLVPGIYEVGGGALKMCLFPASEANTHPTRCKPIRAPGA